MKNHYDVIIIGTGSGGSTIAHRLKDSGLRILILERGGFIPKERENWDPHEVVTNGRYRPDDVWYDQDDRPFKPFIHYNVGGNSKMYGAALFRFRVSDFEKVQHFGGVSPEWPLKYDVFEPYYKEAEYLYCAHGLRGADPTEPWTTSDYPYPPLPYEPLIASLNDALVSAGARPFPLPMGLRLPQEYNQNDAAVSLENFDGYPDPTESKADAHVMALRPALKNQHFTLIPHAYVERLETDKSGRKITVVHAIIRGEKQAFSGGIVIVACGAVNSAALMLRSANTKHPNGLANSSGQLGRNLMLHHNGCLVAFTREPVNDCVFQKSLGIADYYEGNGTCTLPLGEIQLMGRNDPDTITWLAEKIYPDLSYDDLRKRTIDFWLTAEDLPTPKNRVTLTREGKVKVYYERNNYKAYEKLKDKLKELLAEAGKYDARFRDLQWAGYDLDISGMSHQNGTMRFGSDPSDSVLDLNCKAHDLDNLYVVDASFFPSCGAFNPSLTISANALRVGDHLLSNVLNHSKASHEGNVHTA